MRSDDDRHRARATAAAETVLAPLGIASPEELRDSLDDIAAYLRVGVRSAAMDGLSGRLVYTGLGPVVTVNGREPPERRRFSLAHEIGHHEMHGDLKQAFACTPGDMEDYRRSPEEREANHFAANLLMPGRMFLDAMGRETPSIAVAKSVQERFGTSLTATARRLVELTGERAAVVVSGRDGIRYAITNPHFGYAVDQRLPKLDKESYAYDVLEGKPAQKFPSRVSENAWLYFELNDDREQLHESSILLGQYGVALSILWIKEV